MCIRDRGGVEALAEEDQLARLLQADEARQLRGDAAGDEELSLIHISEPTRPY